MGDSGLSLAWWIVKATLNFDRGVCSLPCHCGMSLATACNWGAAPHLLQGVPLIVRQFCAVQQVKI